MHRQFRKLLDDAVGETDFVIAVNLDIRDFSSWSRRVESPQAMLYLKKIYPKIIDEYFDDRWFFKPTGDGLLLVVPFRESELASLVETTLRRCLELVDQFATVCSDEPMVNFPVPPDIGIGIAQGAASRLVSGSTVLDYSGRVLNLASRLMELARPRGVVFDSGFGHGILPADLEEQFTSQTGFIRGVSPEDPITIRYVDEQTEIPPSFTQRPGDYSWETARKTFTLKDMENMGNAWWRFDLPHAPADISLIKCTATFDALTPAKKRIPNQTRTRRLEEYEYMHDAGVPVVRVDVATIARDLRQAGVKGTWKVDVRIDYPRK